MNTSGRKHPKHRREGGRKRARSNKAATMSKINSKREKTMDGDMCSYHTNHYYSIQKQVDESMIAIIDSNATGSVHTGGRQFLLENQSTVSQNVTVFRGKSKKLSCPLVTVVAAATTREGEEVICLFHNVAHVHDDNCQCLVLSGPQMKSAGVVVNHLVIAGQQTARESVVTVDDVVFDMSISKPKNNGNVALPSFKLFLFNNSTIEKQSQ